MCVCVCVNVVFLTKYYSGDQIKNEMGGGCSTYEGKGEVHAGVWWGKQGKRPLERTSVDGRIILR